MNHDTETPIFDQALRDHGLVYFPRVVGSLTPARIEPLPPMEVPA